MAAAFEFSRLDQTDPAQAERICRLLRDSYAVEARLIGVEDFAPLRRGIADIRNASSTFHGCSRGGSLVAVAEVEREADGTANIAGFVVDPGAFRKGIGTRLLLHVLQVVGDSAVTVSTASANAPAIALYEKHGFGIRRHWRTDCGIAMVTLERRRISACATPPRSGARPR
jgi:ribosomal protein S18 acetylase RimI-like enzyme